MLALRPDPVPLRVLSQKSDLTGEYESILTLVLSLVRKNGKKNKQNEQIDISDSSSRAASLETLASLRDSPR